MEETIIPLLLKEDLDRGVKMERTEIAKEFENYKQLPGITLAYIGDAVYELEVRKKLVASGMHNANNLHKEAVKRVNANTQSKLINKLKEELTEEEMSFFKRGRNVKPNNVPKKSSIAEYTNSTGFEALIGYLFFKGDYEKINYIVDKVEEILEEE